MTAESKQIYPNAPPKQLSVKEQEMQNILSGIDPTKLVASPAEVATFGQGRRRRKSKSNPKSKKITHKNIRKMQDEIMRVLKG